ncbi:YihY/virulence factor BrkB family protein [Rubellimicrobium roseum]|uniref:YihY/virulence factor BrkB family protein n=1 Tax=Rubellimicrobium roseum TaxID=687525 RepID=A0A5C4N8B0_9RHOB|nr:YihY/virulence factor BrkB family protein [Rubellimicrobium roseum]TNC65153.1 YihY/virulence factor BrkB family protein [Rubellimicrobium roseum]
MNLVLDLPRLFRVAALGWWNDRAMSLGGSISYFMLFSMAPMLLVAISVAGLVFGREAAQGALVGELTGALGQEAAQAVEALIANAGDLGSGILGTTVGLLIFLVVATGAIGELQDDLNLIWKVPPAATGLRGVLRTRVLSLGVVVGVGFLLLVSLAIDAGLAAGRTYLEGRFTQAITLLGWLNRLVSFAIAAALFAMIFRVLPNVALTWRDVAIGALVTALLFTVGKVLIGIYIGQSGIASSYGAAASFFTILLWIYYSSLILLFGAEFTKAFAESHGTRIRNHQPEA